MDRLPIELISLIAEHLQQWYISDQPFSHLTETSKDPMVTSKDEPVGWLTHTSDSHEDILNFRLVCQVFYNSSLHIFGELLDSRIFRITKFGLEELQALAGVATMRPHIRKLTFGNAQFDDPAFMSGNRSAVPWRISSG